MQGFCFGNFKNRTPGQFVFPGQDFKAKGKGINNYTRKSSYFNPHRDDFFGPVDIGQSQELIEESPGQREFMHRLHFLSGEGLHYGRQES